LEFPPVIKFEICKIQVYKSTYPFGLLAIRF
jgi:hypothetical protein